MSKDKDVMLFGAIALGVYVMSRRPAMANTVPRPGGLTSVPASVGSGAGQAIGGALGGLLSSMLGSKSPYTPDGGGAIPVPDWDAGYQANPELLDNVMLYGI